jgi:hypothetical protein
MRGEIDFLVRVGANEWETRRGPKEQFNRRFVSPRHLLYGQILDRLRNHHYFGIYFQEGSKAHDAIVLGNRLFSMATQSDAANA